MSICLYCRMSESEKKPGRPKQCRRIRHSLTSAQFAPDCRRVVKEVDLGLDELEALRLTDYEGFYQADAAKMMNISRQTLGRMLKSAHQKVADSLINGKRLNIHGGNVKHSRQGGGTGSRRRRNCPKGETKQAHTEDLK